MHWSLFAMMMIYFVKKKQKKIKKQKKPNQQQKQKKRRKKEKKIKHLVSVQVKRQQQLPQTFGYLGSHS